MSGALRHGAALCALLCAMGTVGCSMELAPARSDPSLGSGSGPGPGGGESVGAPAPLRLLTRAEYARTVRDLLGAGRLGDLDPADGIPAENEAFGFDNIVHFASEQHVEAYQRAAVVLAERVALPTCGTGSGCVSTWLPTFLRRAFRRPPTDQETAAFRSLYEALVPTADGPAAVRAVIQGVLQSPQFLYRVEFDGEVDPRVPGRIQLDDWVLASRLSYLLWASMPDEPLLDAAERGVLSTPAGLAAQVERMWRDPRARDGAENFYRQVLESEGFHTMTKDPGLHPGFTPSTALELERSLHAFMDHAVFEGGLVELFSSRTVFATPELAELYGWPAPSGAFGPVVADGDRRRGLLTQPGLMALLAKPDGSAPIQRGVFVLEKIFCRPPPAPDPDMPVVAPDPDPNATTRERFAQHTEDEACASCHQYIDPVGFAFEHYDAIGRWREQENGLPVDPSGAITLAEDPSLAGPVANAVEMADRLAEADEIPACIARQWFRYGLGRVEVESDLPTLERLGRVLADTGSFESMLVEFVSSEPFRTRARTEESLR